MNKINNLKQLNDQQKILVQRKAELEKAIRYDWMDLKKGLRPKTIMEKLFQEKESTEHTQHKNRFVTELLSALLSRLVSKMSAKPEGKTSNRFKN